MALRPKTNLNVSEQFNDGVLTRLKASDGVITESLVNFPYGEKTVGIKRFYNAKVSGSEISMMVSVPYNHFIRQKDLVELHSFHTDETKVFRIDLLQFKDTAPKSLWLTLVKEDIEYDDRRI